MAVQVQLRPGQDFLQAGGGGNTYSPHNVMSYFIDNRYAAHFFLYCSWRPHVICRPPQICRPGRLPGSPVPKTATVSEDPHNLQASISEGTSDLHEECPGPSREVGNGDQCDTGSLRNQLKKKLSSLFLLQAILHVSNTATQEIVDDLNDIFSLSELLIKEAVSDILQRNGHIITEPTLSEVVAAVMDCNVLSTSTSKGAELSSHKRRKTFIERNYPCVMPLEYQL